MSYREKSFAASLLIAIYIFYVYLTGISDLSSAGELSNNSMMGLIVEVIVLSVILYVVSQIVVAIIDYKDANTEDDERDKQIETKSNSLAYHIICLVMFVGIFGVGFEQWMHEWPAVAQKAAATDAHPLLLSGVDQVFSLLNVLIIGYLVADIAKYGSRIYYYQRGF